MTSETSPGNVPLSILLEHFKWQLERFQEVLMNEGNHYFRDAALQRFEFLMASVSKCINRALGENIEDAESFETRLQQALNAGWFPEGTDCGDMIQSLALLAPDSRQTHADEVFNKLDLYHSQFQMLYRNLSELEKTGT